MEQWHKLLGWLKKNRKWVFSGIGVFILGTIVSMLYWLSSNTPPSKLPATNITATDSGIATSGDIIVTAEKGGTAIVTTRDISVNVDAIVETLLKKYKRSEVWSNEQAHQFREQALQDQIKVLTEAVNALVAKVTQPDSPPGIGEGLAQLKQGNTEAAEAIFEQIVERKTTDIQEAAEALRNLGALAFLHDTNKALSAYHRSIELDPNNNEGWNQLGHLLVRTGKFDEAKTAFLNVLNLGQREQNIPVIATAYDNLGVIYSIQAEFDQAEGMHRKALKMYGALGNDRGLAISFNNLSIVYLHKDKLDQAENMIRKSLEIHDALGNERGLVSNYLNLGILCQERGELDQAENIYQRALKISTTIGNDEFIAIIYGAIGSLHQERGELDQAENMYQKALATSQALGYRAAEANAYGSLADVYQKRGDLDQAEMMYRKALDIDKELGRKDLMADSYEKLGTTYESKGNFNQAIDMYQKALRIYKDLGNKVKVASNYSNLGIIVYHNGDFEQAKVILYLALERYKELGDSLRVASLGGILGFAYLQLESPEPYKAEAVWSESVAIFQKLDDIQNVKRIQVPLDMLRAKLKKQ